MDDMMATMFAIKNAFDSIFPSFKWMFQIDRRQAVSDLNADFLIYTFHL